MNESCVWFQEQSSTLSSAHHGCSAAATFIDSKPRIRSAAMCRYERARLSRKPVYKVRLAPTTPRQSHSPHYMGYKAVNPAHRIGGSRPSDCVGVQGLAKSAATPLHHNHTERPPLQSLWKMPPSGDTVSVLPLLFGRQ